jgi:citrate synthase
MSEQSLTIRDDRTGKSYTLPIENGTVRAMDLRQIKTDADEFGLIA